MRASLKLSPLVLALALALASPVAAAPAKHAPGAGVEVKSIQRALDAELLDFPSARFRDVHMTQDRVDVCGWVNSKNRMGGYVGWTQFHAIPIPGAAAYLTLASDEVSAQVAAQSCAKSGLQWGAEDLSAQIAAHK